MGIFDKLLSRKEPEKKKGSTDIIKPDQEKSLVDQSSIEKAIAERRSNIDLSTCLKAPISEVSALGTGFAQMIPSLRKIAMDGVGYLPVNMEPGAALKIAKDGTNWGAYIAKDGSSKMVKWVQAGPTSVQMPINPGMIMVAVMLANIEKKLDAIQQTQMKILSFLELDKEAGQHADMKFLMDTLQGYKYNWDNDQYLSNHHVKALDIKQSAEANIEFYQKRIAEAIKKLPAIHLDQAAKGTVLELGKLYSQYRLALYLFAFSSFLEVMLLGNFRQEYLDQVSEKVLEYNEQYKTDFSKCHDMIKEYSAGSIEKKVLDGIGNAGKALGKLIAANPFLAKGPVDEWLKDGGDSILKGSEEMVKKTIALFSSEENTGSELFVDSIKNVGLISNKTTDILIDRDTVYLAVD